MIDLLKDRTHPPIRKERPPDIPKYLAFVRSHGCLVPDCHNAAEAHHLVFRSKGNSRSDILTVPLCTIHHTGSESVHALGFDGFEERYCIEFHRIVIALLTEWIINSTLH